MVDAGNSASTSYAQLSNYLRSVGLPYRFNFGAIRSAR